METAIVKLSHDVEQKGVRVVIEGLVVEEELRQQTEVLCIAFVLSAVDFEEGNRVFAVDFVAGRISQVAFGDVPLQTLSALPVLQAEFTDIDAVECAELLGVWREVPGLDSVLAELNQLNVLHPGDHVVVVGDHAARLSWRLFKRLLRVVVQRHWRDRCCWHCADRHRSRRQRWRGDRRSFAFAVDFLLKSCR